MKNVSPVDEPLDVVTRAYLDAAIAGLSGGSGDVNLDGGAPDTVYSPGQGVDGGAPADTATRTFDGGAP